MNFDYNKNFSNYYTNNKIFKKGEEENKKENESVKKEEEEKAQAIVPQKKKVTANADEILTNYIKAMVADSSKSTSPSKGTQLDDRAGGNVPDLDRLIGRYESLNENVQPIKRLQLLAQIISHPNCTEEQKQEFKLEFATVIKGMENLESIHGAEILTPENISQFEECLKPNENFILDDKITMLEAQIHFFSMVIDGHLGDEQIFNQKLEESQIKLDNLINERNIQEYKGFIEEYTHLAEDTPVENRLELLDKIINHICSNGEEKLKYQAEFAQVVLGGITDCSIDKEVLFAYANNLEPEESLSKSEKNNMYKAREALFNKLLSDYELNEEEKSSCIENLRNAKIGLWETKPNTITNNAKMELLTQIIDLFGDDEDGARNWRARRACVSYDIYTQEQLAIFYAIENHDIEYNPSLYSDLSSLEIDEKDMESFQYYINNHDNLNEEEQLLYLEFCGSSLSAISMQFLFNLKNPDISNSEYAHSKAFARSSAIQIYNSYLNIVQNPQMQDEEWQTTFTQFNELFNQFNSIISHQNALPLDISEVEEIVPQLLSLIEELNEQGFPYCDKLRLVITLHLESREIPAEIFNEENIQEYHGYIDEYTHLAEDTPVENRLELLDKIINHICCYGEDKLNYKAEFAQVVLGGIADCSIDKEVLFAYANNLEPEESLSKSEKNNMYKAREALFNKLLSDYELNEEEKSSCIENLRNAKIGLWETKPNTVTNNAKMELLTQIINLFGDDEDGARIWRVRRFSVSQNISAINMLQYWQRLQNGEQYDYHNLPKPSAYADDVAAYRFMGQNLSFLDENEILAHDEVSAMQSKAFTIFMFIQALNNDPNYHLGLNEIKYRARACFNYIKNVTDNPINADEPWQEKFAEYKTKFEEFQNTMENPEHYNIAVNITDVGEIPIAQYLISQLNSLISELREQGFPYCDDLLISIQGYLVFAGHNDINVLPSLSSPEINI